MTLIKAATVYQATIPTDTTTLHNHLAEHPFKPMTDLDTRGFGFVPVHQDSCNLVEPFAGGFAFRVRIDEKIIPGSVVNASVQERVAQVKAQTGRKPGKAERAEIKEDVLTELAKVALVRTVCSITCFYHLETKFLIVPTTSQKIADICTSLLVHAVGSVKTETINVSDVKHGLTTRLQQWLRHQDGDHFGAFYPQGEAQLADSSSRRITFKMTSLASVEGLQDALNKDFQVQALGFQHDIVDFTLTDKFRLRGIGFETDAMHMDGDTAEDLWAADASIEVDGIAGVVAELCKMLAYQEPEGGQAQEEGAA